ncbi:PREDICTED: flavonol synthase/flavanone 3-hydroxylase-like [Tarenaya hassleriana]|uniref:flavonol synthase/flavanone 3-hydroxylase-like n=1 Tax=Tarenaya hassleriana TaxID=28532 RepID=UPI00053C8EF7|nr:PREDICTED: flavonol synthase/flavanone 3-hydroxylase-like [Tarenaya hassleriana]
MEVFGEAFIQAPEHRAGSNFTPEEPEEIPVIDLSRLEDPEDAKNVVSEIGKACEKWGFFQVINHGIPCEARQRVESVARAFFDMGMEEKMKIKRDEVNPVGYHDGEHTKNVRDWKEVFDVYLNNEMVLPASPDPEDEGLRVVYNKWPQQPSEFRGACEEYARHAEKLEFKLLELISLSLGLTQERFNGYFEKQMSFLRINRYPPCPRPDLALGVGRHKDADVLSILAQDQVGGLQVSRRSDGVWFNIRPIPHALVINIGNCMEVWTNDKYWSAEHRVVVNSTKERFSIPFFMMPSHDVEVKPLEELSSHQSPPKYKGYKWGKFYVSRNRSDFRKLQLDNIQIHHFKLPA